jgi:hypothetical protein
MQPHLGSVAYFCTAGLGPKLFWVFTRLVDKDVQLSQSVKLTG